MGAHVRVGLCENEDFHVPDIEGCIVVSCHIRQTLKARTRFWVHSTATPCWERSIPDVDGNLVELALSAYSRSVFTESLSERATSADGL
jgi:hypothetical protein